MPANSRICSTIPTAVALAEHELPVLPAVRFILDYPVCQLSPAERITASGFLNSWLPPATNPSAGWPPLRPLRR